MFVLLFNLSFKWIILSHVRYSYSVPVTTNCIPPRNRFLAPPPLSGGVGGGSSAVFDVFLESRWYRQAVDEVESNVAQDGELTEVLQRVHAAEP